MNGAAMPMRVGLLGCGNIAAAYCTGLAGSPHVTLVACADRDGANARALAARHGLRALTGAELLAAPDIDRAWRHAARRSTCAAYISPWGYRSS